MTTHRDCTHEATPAARAACRRARTRAASDSIALQVIVAARKSDRVIDKVVVAEHLSECMGGHRGYYLQEQANAADWRLVLKLAHEYARSQGDLHLIPTI